jgi:hypothetical protein
MEPNLDHRAEMKTPVAQFAPATRPALRCAMIVIRIDRAADNRTDSCNNRTKHQRLIGGYQPIDTGQTTPKPLHFITLLKIFLMRSQPRHSGTMARPWWKLAYQEKMRENA